MTVVGRIWVVVLTILASLVFAGIWFLRSRPTSDRDGSASVVVLIDFSKSFMPSTGLIGEDRSALSAVAEQIVLLTSRYKTVKILWLPIEDTSSADPLCEPVEVTPSLVKLEGKLTTRDDVDSVFRGCLAKIFAASKDKRNLANYTHISGAVAMAAASTQGNFSERVLVIFSDLKEDLAPASHAASFHLSNEQVILLHRPASDEPLDVQLYLARVGSWKKKLLESGAGQVVEMPLFSVSEARLRAALQPRELRDRTSVTMLVDFKANPFPPGADGLADTSSLVSIGKAIADLAPGWPQPVTAQWIAVADSGFRLRAEPTVEFWQKLIKPPDVLTDPSDFARLLDETARALPSVGNDVSPTDLSGTIDLVASAEPEPRSHILIIVSDFSQPPPMSLPFNFTAGTQVVMLFKPSLADQQDPDAGAERRARWVSRLRNSHALNVCQYPLASWGPYDFRSCLVEPE